MNGRLVLLSLVLAGSSVVFAASVYAQGFSIDLSAGRIVYDPVSVNLGTNNAMATLRYDMTRGAWVYGTGAAPLRNGDPVWGAFGAGGRFTQAVTENRPLFLGVDVDGHGFLFRDTVALLNGTGGALEAIPFASVAAGPGRIELRGGWRGQRLSFASETQGRGVVEGGARAIYGLQVRVQGDMKWVHAPEGTFPFVGGSVVYGGVPVQVWAQTGKWLSDQLNDVAWGAGVGVALGNSTTFWGSVRQEPPDPLYWNALRRTWSVGMTRRLGRAAPVLLPAPRSDADGVVVRVPVADAPGDVLFIAGDFNQWMPVPMQREGREWTIRLPLPKGAYHYAFRSARGTWFVPASIPGRRDDGMGGQVAVLLVM
ncbi:MAG TPA: hypothetical protein VH436_32195 [Vicinamibacterales bacterium]|jgi:hypothetical protein